MNDISEMKRKICDSIRILPVWIIFAIVTLTAVGCAPRQDELIIESESADTGEVETTKDISKDDAEKTEQTVQTVETLQADVFVHVCGAVKNPHCLRLRHKLQQHILLLFDGRQVACP